MWEGVKKQPVMVYAKETFQDFLELLGTATKNSAHTANKI